MKGEWPLSCFKPLRHLEETLIAQLNPRRDSFACVFDASRPALFRFALRVVKDEADAEDAVQEAARRAWHTLGSLRDERWMRTWLFQITFHAAISLVRRRRRNVGIEAGEDLPDLCQSPEGLAISRQFAGRMKLQLHSLSLKYREPLVLRFLMGYSYAEIGERLGMRENAVKLRVWRARRMLTERFGKPLESENT
jgi:RNA polymerase sigma-70 factor, ECF subfamily